MRLDDVARGKWVNLDGQVHTLQAFQALDTALRDASVEALSLRYCKPSEQAAQRLVDLVANNATIEVLYLHMSELSDKIKDALVVGWKAHGSMHRVTNNGWTFQRKVDLRYLEDRARHVPQWALAPPAAPKKKKKGVKKKKK